VGSFQPAEITDEEGNCKLDSQGNPVIVTRVIDTRILVFLLIRWSFLITALFIRPLFSLLNLFAYVLLRLNFVLQVECQTCTRKCDYSSLRRTRK